MNLLADSSYGKMITQCFKMLTQTDDGYLDKESFCSVKLVLLFNLLSLINVLVGI